METYVHKDIAFEFGKWISPKFKLLLIKKIERLKAEEKINYIYAKEADVLNIALFGITAKQWRTKNPNLERNIRDYATINELICFANLENLNSVFINDGLPKRLKRLNVIAISQMQILNNTDIKYLNGGM